MATIIDGETGDVYYVPPGWTTQQAVDQGYVPGPAAGITPTATPPAPTPPGGSGDTTPSTTPVDWRVFLADWGFPSDVTGELDRIFKTYSDPSQAAGAALAYIRGTDWYRTTFPGINEGIRKGIVSDEASYRSYVNQINDLYQRYYGRGVTGAEIGNYLMGGKGYSRINGELAGEAYIKANKGDIQQVSGQTGQGLLSDEELQAYGWQQAGLDNGLGQIIGQRIQEARTRLDRLFQGVLATPSYSLANGRLQATSLGGPRNAPDIGA